MSENVTISEGKAMSPEVRRGVIAWIAKALIGLPFLAAMVFLPPAAGTGYGVGC